MMYNASKENEMKHNAKKGKPPGMTIMLQKKVGMMHNATKENWHDV